MGKDFIDPAGAEGRDIALRFLNAIKDEDAVTFWSLLDKRGQGYFMGMWFLALADADIRTIEGLAGESGFLNGALRPVVENLKNNLKDLLDRPSVGEVHYIDDQHAAVSVLNTASGDAAPDGPEEYIPLVLELAPAGGASTALTCWKVDTFRCIQFGKT